ncbi:UNVERIFIED_CONTAM: hypothetical protein Sindi_0963800 [Sesamum indicum]
MEAFEANSIMLTLRHLRENLEELDRNFRQRAVNAQVAGQIQRADLDTVQVSPSGMTHELREHNPKHAFKVQGSRLVALDSSTDRTRPPSNSGEKPIIESQEVQTPIGSCQSRTSAV